MHSFLSLACFFIAISTSACFSPELPLTSPPLTLSGGDGGACPAELNPQKTTYKQEIAQLPTSSCCIFNRPPWFCTLLPQPTTDDIELRICLNEDLQENVAVSLVEIYVQWLQRESDSHNHDIVCVKVIAVELDYYRVMSLDAFSVISYTFITINYNNCGSIIPFIRWCYSSLKRSLTCVLYMREGVRLKHLSLREAVHDLPMPECFCVLCLENG